jgi:hypothetical protein
MSAMKRFAEQVSVELGFDGEINEEVLAEAQRRLDQRRPPKWDENLARRAASEYGEEQCLRHAEGK